MKRFCILSFSLCLIIGLSITSAVAEESSTITSRNSIKAARKQLRVASRTVAKLSKISVLAKKSNKCFSAAFKVDKSKDALSAANPEYNSCLINNQPEVCQEAGAKKFEQKYYSLDAKFAALHKKCFDKKLDTHTIEYQISDDFKEARKELSSVFDHLDTAQQALYEEVTDWD